MSGPVSEGSNPPGDRPLLASARRRPPAARALAKAGQWIAVLLPFIGRPWRCLLDAVGIIGGCLFQCRTITIIGSRF